MEGSIVDRHIVARGDEKFISYEIEGFEARLKRRLNCTYTRVVLTEKIIDDQKHNDTYTRFSVRERWGPGDIGCIIHDGGVDLTEADILSCGC